MSIGALIEAAEQNEAVRSNGDGLQEVVGDNGYHSNQALVDLEAVGALRTQLQQAQAACAANALRLERPFAHA